MKRKNVLLFGVIIFFSVFTSVNAKNTLENLTEGTVITNDEVVLRTSDYYVAYYDKNDKLLDVFALPFGWYKEDGRSFKAGHSCKDIALYNGSTEASADEKCTTESMLIYSSGVDYSEVKMWQVVSNTYFEDGSDRYWSYDTTDEFCALYEGTDAELPFLCNLLDGWGSDDQSYKDDYAHYNLIKFQEYDTSQSVKFEWVCTPKEVQKDDIVFCDLKVNSVETLLDFKLDLKNDLFEVKNVTGKEDWNVEVKGDSYSFVHEGFLGKSTIATFKIIIKETNDKKNIDIPIEELSFNTKSGYKDIVSLTDNVKVKEVVDNNPGTSDINIIIIVTISFVSLGVFVVILNHKKKIKNLV